MTRKFDVIMKTPEGKITFEKQGVIAPAGWSDRAITVAAVNYLRDDEFSIPDMFNEVIETIFQDAPMEKLDDDIKEDLYKLMIGQKAMFNSPVLFNYRKNSKRLQGSACFIFDRKDDMDDILTKTTYEAQVFHYGSGVGCDYSDIREENAPIGGGGKASGPISFMLPCDAWAKTIKSGGRTRRAAKYVGLKDSHPDCWNKFVPFKANEEEKAKAMMLANPEKYMGNSFNNEAYDTVAGQTANYSVNMSDEFMERASDQSRDPNFDLLSRNPKKFMEVVGSVNAHEELMKLAEFAHATGDPGLIFRDAINRMNMVSKDGEIKAPNPCGEFMGMPDSACNLASLNLVKFMDSAGDIMVRELRAAVRVLIVAMDLIASLSWYPYEEMRTKTQKYRPLGLGFTNLAGYLMRAGIAYDSDEGRCAAKSVMETITIEAWKTSFYLAEVFGAPLSYSDFGYDMNYVVETQCNANLKYLGMPEGVMPRNTQVTLIAPTGTISFLMDCDSTGIEPVLAPYYIKTLVSGEQFVTLSPAVLALAEKADYDVGKMKHWLEEHNTLKGFVKPGDYKYFQTALDEKSPEMVIGHEGHLLMQSEVQQRISSAISKTINLPEETTPKEIFDIYVRAWELGLKGITVYRNNCKMFQPVSTTDRKEVIKEDNTPARVKPENDRLAFIHRFDIGGHKGYITIGCYQDGSICELFTTLSNHGSTISGLLDAWAKQVSLSIQYGVPLESIIQLHSGSIFEPRGITDNSEMRIVTSIIDYVVKYLGHFYAKPAAYLDRLLDIHSDDDEVEEPVYPVQAKVKYETEICGFCGSVSTREPGTHCFYCRTCGKSTGCS